MAKDSLDTREKDKLNSLLENVDNIVMHKYISNLDKCLVLQQNFDVAFKVDESKLTDKDRENLCVVGQNVRLLQIKRFVSDKTENILEKLTTVYNATSSHKNATLLMLIKCKQTKTEIYLGTVCKYSNDDFVPQQQIEAFKKNFEAYFPGSEIESIEIDKTDNNKKCIQDVIYSIFEKEINISTLSGIPALKNKNCFENNNFVQGFEKLIDSIKGKDCSVLIFADPIENNVREAIKAGYEEIYTGLKPFERSEYNINEPFCHSSLQCFLVLISYGTRAGGGIGDVLPIISFKHDVKMFIGRFIYDMTFFIIIIMIMGNVTFGLIVDTFGALRDETYSYEKDRNNVCFICQISRDRGLQKNIDYTIHIKRDHNLWSYVDFLTYLHLYNANDFTRNEGYVWDKLIEKDYGWLPIDTKTGEDDEDD